MNSRKSAGIRNLCKQALSNRTLTRDEIVELLSVSDFESLEVLRQASEEALRRSVGESVKAVFCLSVSNFCEHNCSYCDYRVSNSDIKRFRLSVDDVIEMISVIPADKQSVLILDGAQDSAIDLDFASRLFKAFDSVKSLPELVFAFGERPYPYYEELKKRGMTDYVLDHKTSSPILYNSLHPQQNFFDRRKAIIDLKKLNINVGSSMMIGFPKQDLWDLADDLLTILETGMNMIIIGPFVPGPSSPLANSPRGTIQATLNAIAVARLVLKNTFIPAGLTFRMLDSGSPVEALRWGADGVMFFLQPDRTKDGSITSSQNNIRTDFNYVATRISSLGRVIGCQ